MDTRTVQCPYCGEPLEVALDRSVRRQEYIEDCQVCCRPIVLTVTFEDEHDEHDPVHVVARSEED